MDFGEEYPQKSKYYHHQVAYRSINLHIKTVFQAYRLRQGYRVCPPFIRLGLLGLAAYTHDT